MFVVFELEVGLTGTVGAVVVVVPPRIGLCTPPIATTDENRDLTARYNLSMDLPVSESCMPSEERVFFNVFSNSFTIRVVCSICSTIWFAIRVSFHKFHSRINVSSFKDLRLLVEVSSSSNLSSPCVHHLPFLVRDH